MFLQHLAHVSFEFSAFRCWTKILTENPRNQNFYREIQESKSLPGKSGIQDSYQKIQEAKIPGKKFKIFREVKNCVQRDLSKFYHWAAVSYFWALVTLYDTPEITCRNIARTAQIGASLKEFCEVNFMLHLQKILENFIQESCKKPSDNSKKLPRKCMISGEFFSCFNVNLVAIHSELILKKGSIFGSKFFYGCLTNTSLLLIRFFKKNCEIITNTVWILQLPCKILAKKT